MVIQVMKEEHHASIQNILRNDYLSQDTVVAIHALAEYARLVFGGESNLGIAFSYKEHCLWNSIFVINDGNRLVLQRADLDQLPKAIAVIATGEGCALLQVKFVLFDVGNDCNGEKQKKTKAKQDQVYPNYRI